MTISDKEHFDARIDELKATLVAQIDTRANEVKAELKAELHSTIVSTVKWCASIAATTVLVFTTIVAFLMNNAIPRAPTAASAAPAPTVIVVPQMPALPAQALTPPR